MARGGAGWARNLAAHPHAVESTFDGPFQGLGDFRNTVSFGDTTLTFRGGGSVNGGGDIFLSKLSPEGEFLWTKSFGGNGEDNPASITVNSFDEIVVTANVNGAAEFGQLQSAESRVMAKITKNGDVGIDADAKLTLVVTDNMFLSFSKLK